MKTLIRGGLLIDPANRVHSKLNLVIEQGKVAEVTTQTPEADLVIDAANRVVCPGFVDIHMHEDPLTPENTIRNDDATAIFRCMLRMGVTTAIGGNCGINLAHPADYLDIVDRCGAAVNVGMMAGHAFFRERAGCHDKYGKATAEQCLQMAEETAQALRRGCMGVSLGVRYTPGVDSEELTAVCTPCVESGKLVSAHVRSDTEAVFDSAKEVLDIGRLLHIPVQLSHIGSMAGFGQMERLLQMVDVYKQNGLDVACDCYPYEAFSTHIGSATFDDGWMDRYSCGYDAIELCEGTHRGQRCTEELFFEMRRAHPTDLVICHVMQRADVNLAFRHPNVMLGSDGLLDLGQGHPRAAGAFPRFIARYSRDGELDLHRAIAMMTSIPANRLGLDGKGRLNRGADADVTIFDPAVVADRATFAQPTLPPVGIDCVLIGGQLAARQGAVVAGDLGRSVRKY